MVDKKKEIAPLKGARTPEAEPVALPLFKDAQGRFRTQSLFIEHPHPVYPAHFTLKKFPKKGAISMYQKYMEIADPTEYQVAVQLLGSWDHWQMLTRSKWFTKELTGWREELKIRLESERYHEMVANVADPKTTVQATKWLAARYGDKATQVKKRGRPSKEERQAYLNEQMEAREDTDEDAERIGLN